MRSLKLRNAILVISTILVFVLLGGFVASIVTETPPNEWFKKDDVIIDEPIVEEILPLVATNEEEMNALLVEENVGKTVTYTGETIKNVDLPVAVGDTITHLCMDTSVDIKDWVLGLDWENAIFREVQEDGDMNEMIFVVLCGGATFDYIRECFDAGVNPSEGGPLIMIQHYRNAEGTDEFYMMGFGSTYAWVHDVNGNLGYEFEGWNAPSGDTGFPNVDIEDCVISDILPEYLAGDCFFFGPEEGNYGSVEVVYENNVEYQIVANENGDGCHFEKID